MHQTIKQLIDPQHHDKAQTLINRYQHILQLLIQASEGGYVAGTATQCQIELSESIDLVNNVIQERLSTNPNEWKEDEKQQYQAFFKSIETQSKETVNIHFTSPTKLGVGFAISKFDQLAIQPLVELVRLAGPSNGCDVASLLADYGKQILQQTEQDDLHQAVDAHRQLAEYSRQLRQSKRKPPTKQQRLQMIATAVERVQVE